MTVLDNWKEILAIAAPFLTFFAGRKATKLLEKKQQADAVDTMQKTYDVFLIHYNKQYEEVVTRLDKLQGAFLDLQLSYAKEIETSAKWKQLHSELEKQYKDLERKYNIIEMQNKEANKKHSDLEKLYEKLKADFEKYKKQH